jgi:diacylglycerol kinase
MLRAEPNARLHAVATALVIAAGLAFAVTRGEWLALTLAIVAVWSAEAINTALITAAGAAIVAALIFLPRLFALAG